MESGKQEDMETGGRLNNGDTILLYVSQYQNKYYYNPDIGPLPEAVKKELLMNLIFITEEAGGVAELGFHEDGELFIDSYCEEGDLGYDAVAGGMLVSEMEHQQAETLEQVQNWYLEMLREKGEL